LVAGEASDLYAQGRFIPVVEGEQDEALFHEGDVGQGVEEAVVEYVPVFSFILAFVLEYAEDGGAAFAYGIAAEFGVDVGFGEVVLAAVLGYGAYDFFCHLTKVV